MPEATEDPDISGISSVRSSSAAYSGWSAIQHSDENTAEEFWNEERRRRWVRDVASPISSGQRTEDDDELDETEAEDTFIAGELGEQHLSAHNSNLHRCRNDVCIIPTHASWNHLLSISTSSPYPISQWS